MNDNSLYMRIEIDAGPPLLEIEAYCLRACPEHRRWDSVVTHGCGVYEPNFIAPLDSKIYPCPDCGAEVPEEIVAAWILHNYDQVQQGEHNG